jgi:hypothetical protein
MKINADTTDPIALLACEVRIESARAATCGEAMDVLRDAREEASGLSFEEALARFVSIAQGICDAYMARSFPTLARPVLVLRRGPRYVKILRCEHGRDSGSMHCLVDTRTGDVLKSAGGGPAKHPRGNIWDADGGAGAVGPYGATRLR